MHLFIGSSITKARQCKKLKNKNYICACPISLQTFSLNDLGQIENYWYFEEITDCFKSWSHNHIMLYVICVYILLYDLITHIKFYFQLLWLVEWIW